MKVTKQALIPILLILMVIGASVFGIAGTILGEEPVTEFTITKYSVMDDETYCFKIEGLENAEPCLNKDELILDKGNISATSIQTLKDRLENIRQVNLINEARTEISQKTCVINSDCVSTKAITSDTWYCVKQQCTTKAPTTEIESALDKLIGVKQ